MRFLVTLASREASYVQNQHICLPFATVLLLSDSKGISIQNPSSTLKTFWFSTRQVISPFLFKIKIECHLSDVDSKWIKITCNNTTIFWPPYRDVLITNNRHTHQHHFKENFVILSNEFHFIQSNAFYTHGNCSFRRKTLNDATKRRYSLTFCIDCFEGS